MAQEEEDLCPLGDCLPSFDVREMDELYQHFLMFDMPEDDDADEDFEPPAHEDDDDGDEAAAQTRNIHSRELTDLLEDAYNQLGPSTVSQEFRGKVSDQLSMHFQLLVQTSVLATKASPSYDKEKKQALGMLEHLSSELGPESKLGTRTRAMLPSVAWGANLPSTVIPGLGTVEELGREIQEAGSLDHPKGNPRQAVERLISSKGGVVWHSLLPSKMLRGVTWHKHYNGGARRLPGAGDEPVGCPTAAQAQHGEGTSAVRGPVDCSRSSLVATHPAMIPMFSRVEDRLFWRGVHWHQQDWDKIQATLLPHKSRATLSHRFSMISEWASAKNRESDPRASQGHGLSWSYVEDVKLRDAVKAYGTRWSYIAQHVMPLRGKESLRSRWASLQGMMKAPRPGAAGDGAQATTRKERGASHTARPRNSRKGPTIDVETHVGLVDEADHTLSDDESTVCVGEDYFEEDAVGLRLTQASSPHRITYAEDELSDDSDEISSTQSARGSRHHVAHVAHEPRPGQATVQSLGESRSDTHGEEDAALLPQTPLGASDSVFEEDELTDDGDDDDGRDEDAPLSGVGSSRDQSDYLQSEGARQSPWRSEDPPECGDGNVESNGNGLRPGSSSVGVSSTLDTRLLGGDQR